MDNVENDPEIETSLSLACTVCGCIYGGNKDDFDALPVDYHCFKCGAAKVNFRPFKRPIKINKN